MGRWTLSVFVEQSLLKQRLNASLRSGTMSLLSLKHLVGASLYQLLSEYRLAAFFNKTFDLQMSLIILGFPRVKILRCERCSTVKRLVAINQCLSVLQPFLFKFDLELMSL